MRCIDADVLEGVLEIIPAADIKNIDGQAYVLVRLSQVFNVIKNAPPIEPEQRWIPCSERLPEDDTLMLVNYIDHRPDAMDIWIGWHEMENVWYIDGEAHSEEYGNEVIAWMPLPIPYKENKNEN